MVKVKEKGSRIYNSEVIIDSENQKNFTTEPMFSKLELARSFIRQ